jgi:hypothetical protein
MTESNSVSTNVNHNDEDFSDTIIQGTKLKFSNNAEWLTRDGEPISPDREFVVVEIKRVVQKWKPGQRKPETRYLQPGEPWPDVDKLNAEAPQSEWREAFGQRKGPYEKCHAVYLLDPRTFVGFTFPTATTGGHIAVREFNQSQRNARLMRGPNVYAVVTLSHTLMKTDYGNRQRPFLKIKDWIALGGGESIPAQNVPLLPQGSAATATTKPQPADTAAAARAALRSELNDDIPFSQRG